MRAAWAPTAACALLVACKDTPQQRTANPEVTTDTSGFLACELAVDKAAAAPLAARPALLFAGCPMCSGGWTPLLRWNVEASESGPRREHIEQTMVTCKAFCTGTAKLEFMGAVDKARGGATNKPWRELGKTCRDKVSAHVDDRFMSAPYFALDRIAREVFAPGSVGAKSLQDKLVALELPLPAWTVSGAGVELPAIDQSGVIRHDTRLHVTLVADTVYVGTLPRAKLTATGIELDLGTPPYPGEQVTPDKLVDKLRELVAGSNSQPVIVLAPRAMPASKLVPLITAASAVVPLHLGIRARESLEGWQLPEASAAPLRAELVTEGMTVDGLAALVAK